MSKPQSPATELRHLKTEHRMLREQHERVKVELTGYRARATKAETEAAEWRKRFDMLLAKGFVSSEDSKHG